MDNANTKVRQSGYAATISIPEAAGRLSIGRSKLYELLFRGEIKARKIGRRTVIEASEIDRFRSQLPSAVFGETTKAA